MNRTSLVLKMLIAVLFLGSAGQVRGGSDLVLRSWVTVLLSQQGSAAIAEQAKALEAKMNAFCLGMYRTYNDGSDEFFEAYREAYELLLETKKMTRLATSGAAADALKAPLSGFTGELEHIEHHLEEFSAGRKDVGADRAKVVSDNLAEVEAALEPLAKELGIALEEHHGHKHGDEKPDDEKHDHKHGSEPAGKPSVSARPISDAELVDAMKKVQTAANALCVAMHKTYNDESEEFYEAYREAYEVLQLSTESSALASKGGGITACGPLLTEIDGEIHHIETHIEEFAEKMPNRDAAGKQAVAQRLEEFETALHAAMSRTGLSRQHAEDALGAGHGAQKPRATTRELANSLVDGVNDLCLAMDHNFKKNPDFPEAYAEAYEFLQAARKIASMVNSDTMTAECRELVVDLDGEIHHLEGHIKEFKADDAGSSVGSRRVVRKLTEVEQRLHALLNRAGVEK